MGRLAEAVRSFVLGPYLSSDPALARLFGSGPTTSGISVTEDTALNLSAVWCAVTLIAGTIGSIPLNLYKRVADGGRDRFLDHPLYTLLHDAPNPEMTSVIYREISQAHVLLWGNAYSEIQRDGAGRPIALWPLTPDRVMPYRDVQTRALRYRVTQRDGVGTRVIDPEDMLHVPGLG